MIDDDELLVPIPDQLDVFDEADIASNLEMQNIQSLIKKNKQMVAPETHPDFDGESCVDCGDDIPQLRLDMGRVRCVYCQEKIERKSKLFASKE